MLEYGAAASVIDAREGNLSLRRRLTDIAPMVR
jgi:hypothetical protein